MKKLIYIIAIGLIFLNLSCEDYLDVVPDNVATIDNAFADEFQAEKFLFTCYSFLPNVSNLGSTPGWLTGDEFWVNQEQRTRYYNNSVRIALSGQNANNPLLDYYEGRNSGINLFQGIRFCNTLIERIDGVLGMDDTKKIRWKAEAKFLKAYYHFYMLKMYGPIPIIDQNLSIDSGPEEVKIPRASFDECVSFIVSLLDEAAQDLPLNVQSDLDELGRITKPIVLAVKSDVLLTSASPLFNGNPDYTSFTNIDGTPFFSAYDNEKWKLAADASAEAIAAALEAGRVMYTFQDLIVTDPSDATILKMTLRGRVTDNWNSEVIWGNTVSSDLQSQGQANLTGGHNATQSSLAPTYRVVNQYYTNNGVPITEDKDWEGRNLLSFRIATEDDRLDIGEGEEIPALHFDREPRFYADLGFNRGTWYGQGNLDENNPHVVKSKTGENAGKATVDRFSITGYFTKKIVNYKNTFANATSYRTNRYAFPYMRLSELYLNLAEALNEYNGPSTEAYNAIDLVRERAGLDGVVQSWADHAIDPSKPTDKDGFREIIQRERLIELSFENHRYWDLRRWKLAKSYMNTPIKGWSIDAEENDDYYTLITIHDQKFNNRDYLWPFRTYILSVNTNLVQNPGW